MIFRRASVRLFGGRTGVSFQVSTGTSSRTGCQLELTLYSCVCHKAPHGDGRAQAVDHKCTHLRRGDTECARLVKTRRSTRQGETRPSLSLPGWFVHWVSCSFSSSVCLHRSHKRKSAQRASTGPFLTVFVLGLCPGRHSGSRGHISRQRSRLVQVFRVSCGPWLRGTWLPRCYVLGLPHILVGAMRGVLPTGVCASFVRTVFLIRFLLVSERPHHVHGDPSFFRERFASVHDVVLLSLIPSDIYSPSQTERIAAHGQLRHQRNVRLLR